MNLLSSMWTILKKDKLLQKIIRNSGYLLSSNVLGMGLSIAQGILAGQLLGVAGIGVIGTITVFATTLNKIFSFRMNELVVKYFGEAIARQEKDKAAAIVKAAGIGEITSATLSFLILVLFAPLAAKRLAHDPATAPLFILYGTIILANFTYETAIGVIQVQNHFRNQAIINLVSKIGTASIIAWAYFTHKGLFEILSAYILGKFILGFGTTALGWHEMGKSVGKDWWKTNFSSLPPFKELFGFAFSTNISSTVIHLVRDNELLWIAWFLTPVDAGYTKTALAIINLVQVPITPFISTSYPEINNAVIKQDWNLLRRLLKRITLISGTWTGISTVGLVLFGRWLLMFYGEEFLPAYTPMLLYLIGLGFANILFWNRPLLLSLGLPMVPYRISLFSGIAKIGLAFLLVPRYGLHVEALLLSAFFIVSVSMIVLRGFKEIRIRENKQREASTI
ncbi:MAG: oligosaccharide flippase family protein [Anaerolineaceae bacterium]|nr:oligosaccharide flippase family protein [Anaerolineaceae bacterium]